MMLLFGCFFMPRNIQ